MPETAAATVATAAVSASWLKNPELPGAAFFLPAGSVGVFLSHGFTATPALMMPLAQRLHAQGYTVAGPLLPGHGTTPFELNRCHWGDWVAGAEEVYQRLTATCERVFVGGESLGGLIALYLASVHPEVAGVLAFSPALWLYSRKSALQIQLFWPWRPIVDKPQGRPSHADAFWQGYRVNALGGARELLWFQKTVRRRLGHITQPLLVAQGRLDRTVAVKGPEFLCRATRSAFTELHWLPLSGHCTTIDAEWETVVSLSLDFLARAQESSAGKRD